MYSDVLYSAIYQFLEQLLQISSFNPKLYIFKRRELGFKIKNNNNNNNNFFPLTFCGGWEYATDDVCSSKENGGSQVRNALFQSFLVVHHLSACLTAVYQSNVATHGSQKQNKFQNFFQVARFYATFDFKWACITKLVGGTYRHINHLKSPRYNAMSTYWSFLFNRLQWGHFTRKYLTS